MKYIRLLAFFIFLFTFVGTSLSAQGGLIRVEKKSRIPAPPKNVGIYSNYLALGWKLYAAGRYEEALKTFSKAQSNNATRLDATLGLAYTYLKLGEEKQAEGLLMGLLRRGYRKGEVVRALSGIYLAKGEIGKAESLLGYLTGENRRHLESAIKMRKAIKRAHELKEKGMVQEALDLYWKVLDIKGLDIGEKIALFYEMSDLVHSESEVMRLFKALEGLDKGGLKHKYRKDKEVLRKKLIGILESLAWRAFDARKYEKALKTFKHIESMGLRAGRIHRGIALCYLKLGRYRACKDELRGQQDDPRSLQVFCLCHSAYIDFLVNGDRLDEALEELQGEDAKRCGSEANATSLLWWRHLEGQDPHDPTYPRIHNLGVGIWGSFREKSGDSGISFLQEKVLPGVAFFLPVGEHHTFAVSIKEIELFSGDADRSPWLGTPTLHGPIPSRRPWTRLRATVPGFHYVHHGENHLELDLSQTPDAGVLSGVTTVQARLRRRGFMLRGFSEPVKESLLAYAGQIDPYSGARWGRVLRTGGELGYFMDLSGPRWMSMGVEYAHYDGRGVVSNDSVKLNASTGLTVLDTMRGRLSAGVYGTFMHFSKNSDFYTLGHGGYFSPQSFIALGPFFRFTTGDTHSWRLILDGSLSGLSYSEDDAPYYPLISRDLGTYPKHDLAIGIGYGGRLRLISRLAPHFYLDTDISLGRASDYTEWSALVRLHLFL